MKKILQFIKSLFVKTVVVEETAVTPEEAQQLLHEAAEDAMFAMVFPEANYFDTIPVEEVRDATDREVAEFFGFTYEQDTSFRDVDDDDLPF